MARDHKSKGENAKIELVPDAWAKFEKFVKGIVKAGPQHRAAKRPVRAKKVTCNGGRKPSD